MHLNEGLETLGEKRSRGDTYIEGMTLWGSGIESVSVPSTLKKIEAKTFFRCKKLRQVELAEGLEEIGIGAFQESGLESVVLPSSVRVVGGLAFGACGQLRSARLNDGLEVLGTKECFDKVMYNGQVFW